MADPTPPPPSNPPAPPPPVTPPVNPPAEPPAAITPPAPPVPPTPQPPTDILSGITTEIPEKFVVKDAAGGVDHKATLDKVMTSYREAERTISTYDRAPKEPTEYKLDYGKWGPDAKPEPERETRMLKYFHGKGIGNKAVQSMLDYVGEYLLPEAQKTGDEMAKVASAEVREVWGDTAVEMEAHALRAFSALADKDDLANAHLIGREVKPTYKMLLKVLARLGPEFKEDTPPAGGTDNLADELKTLQTSKAYTDASHPDHKKTVDRVTAIYQEMAAAAK